MEKDEYEYQKSLGEQAQYNQMLGQAHLAQQQAFQDKSIILSQINPSLVLEEIEMTLRGQVKDKEGEIIQKFKPLLNDLGVSRMITFCRCILSQNTTISYLEPEQISPIMYSLSDDLVDDLSLSWKDYNITQKVDLDTINNAVLVPMFLALRRCEGGGERNFLRTQTSEIVSQPPKEKKTGGFLSAFKL